MTITTLLLDCDGVTQGNTSFRDNLTRFDDAPAGGPGLLDAMFERERPYLVRPDGFREALADLLDERGGGIDVDDLFAVWNDTSPVDGIFDLMDAVRARGTRLYLATNQQAVRGAHMRATIPYADHTDGAFYSHDVGHAKPSPAFFQAILDTLDVPADEVLFVDDVAANVDGARAAGLHAEVLEPRYDVDALAAILRRHGLLG